MVGDNMPETFDPYLKWLGIDGGGHTPDHYRLLGLDRLESDPELIGRAADAAMAEVRRIRPGPHLAEWSRLLDQLGVAKSCLLDRRSKATYDESLTRQTPLVRRALAGVPLANLSPIDVEPPPIDIPAATYSGVASAHCRISRNGPGGRRRAHLRDVPARHARGQEQASRCNSINVCPIASFAQVPIEPVKPEPVPPEVVSERETEKPVSKPPPAKPSPESEKPIPERPKPAVDPWRAAAFTRAVADVRTALVRRDLAAASKYIKIASANAQTPEDRDQIDRTETMMENLIQFWSGIRKAMAKLQPAEEIVVGGKPMIVVESNRTYLKVKAEGRTDQFRIEALPTPLVMYLVDRNLGKDPGSLAIIGTFLAVDPHGDRALAKRYWQEAAQAGFDTQKLVGELDAMPAAKK